MKNKTNIRKNIFFYFFGIFFYFNFLIADEVVINADVLEIKDKGDLILATGFVSINDGYTIEINGDKAKYNKKKNQIEILGNVNVFDKERNFKAKSDRVFFDRDKKIISTFNNTEINLINKDNNKNNI